MWAIEMYQPACRIPALGFLIPERNFGSIQLFQLFSLPSSFMHLIDLILLTSPCSHSQCAQLLKKHVRQAKDYSLLCVREREALSHHFH